MEIPETIWPISEKNACFGLFWGLWPANLVTVFWQNILLFVFVNETLINRLIVPLEKDEHITRAIKSEINFSYKSTFDEPIMR